MWKFEQICLHFHIYLKIFTHNLLLWIELLKFLESGYNCNSRNFFLELIKKKTLQDTTENIPNYFNAISVHRNL